MNLDQKQGRVGSGFNDISGDGTWGWSGRKSIIFQNQSYRV